MFCLRYLVEHPNYCSEFDDLEYDQMTMEMRRASTELSFLFHELYLRIKSGQLDPDQLDWGDTWGEGELPYIEYKTATVIPSGASEKDLYIALWMASLPLTPLLA